MHKNEKNITTSFVRVVDNAIEFGMFEEISELVEVSRIILGYSDYKKNVTTQK